MVATITPSSRSLPSDRAADGAVAYWLLSCCAIVFVMIVIGGLTRLTDSGLSITEWRPVAGILPPLSEAAWQQEFELYQRIPEYQQINRGMSLAEFKGIFWWEYVHRLLGRLIAVAFAMPFAVFLARGLIRRALIPHLVAMFLLGGLQGALGWFMVQSGLSVRTDVSQYRLAAHFLVALAVYSYMFWVAMTLLRPGPPAVGGASPLRPHLLVTAVGIVLTLTFGAFVAGLNGGMLYNSFPLMGGKLIPADAFQSPASPFEDAVTAQFVHRWLAMAVVVSAITLWLRRRALSPAAALPIACLAVMALLQAGLGIGTLLLQVPMPLAVAHQSGAVVLWTLALWGLHAAR